LKKFGQGKGGVESRILKESIAHWGGFRRPHSAGFPGPRIDVAKVGALEAVTLRLIAFAHGTGPLIAGLAQT
jgi:hypothetical protein